MIDYTQLLTGHVNHETNFEFESNSAPTLLQRGVLHFFKGSFKAILAWMMEEKGQNSKDLT